MTYNLIVTPKASFDVADACIYYESMEAGLSGHFLSELLVTYDKLRENPQHYSYISLNRTNKLRDVKIKNFPYLVIFKIN